MEMNEQMINKILNDVTSSVKFICEEDLNYLQISSKLEVLNQKMAELETLAIYTNDKTFTNTVCAMQVIANNFNDEIMKEFGKPFSKEFKEKQLNFLRNTSSTFDIAVDDVANIQSSTEEFKEEKARKYNKKMKETKKEYEKKNTKEVVDEIIKKTNEKLNNYFENADDIKEYLTFMSKFHSYSVGNCALIQNQFKGAYAVGSYNFWKEKGFPVKRGEKGIQILVPTPIKRFIDENGKAQYVSKATKEQKEKIKNGELESYTRMGYKQGYVFDVSQTNAKAEDLPKIFPNKWLEGEVYDYDLLKIAMERLSEKIGYKIIDAPYELGVAKGVTFPNTNEIALNPRNSDLQNAKTLLHELAHAKLHTAKTMNDYSLEEREFEAEMVAFTVCSHFGIDTSEYSLKYLDHYTKDTDIKERKKLLNEIRETSAEFIDSIEESLLSFEKERELAYADIDREMEKMRMEKERAELEVDKQLAELEKENKELRKEIEKEDNKDIIYTKFVFSEHSGIEEDLVLPFEEANELVKTLIDIEKAKGEVGYYKTNFELYFDKDCTDKFYSGRVDIGDSVEVDLKTHIYNHLNYYQKEHNLSNTKKNAFFQAIGIEQTKETIEEKKIENIQTDKKVMEERKEIPIPKKEDTLKNKEIKSLPENDVKKEVINKPIKDEEIYIHFISSENEHIEKGDVYSLDDADDLIRTINNIKIGEGKQNKEKIEFALCKGSNLGQSEYNGSFYLGEPSLNDFRDNLADSIGKSSLSENIKESLLEITGIGANKGFENTL